MEEIRMCWGPEVSHAKHEMQPAAEWQPTSEELRVDYQIIAKAANEVFGPRTHWIEERHLRPGARRTPALVSARNATASSTARSKLKCTKTPPIWQPDIVVVLPDTMQHNAQVEALKNAGIPIDGFGHATSGFLFARTTGPCVERVQTFRWFSSAKTV
jgi:hypothetical protein